MVCVARFQQRIHSCRRERKQEGKDKDRKERGEREKKQKSFGVRAPRTHHPVQEAWHPPSPAGTRWPLLACRLQDRAAAWKSGH